MKEIKIDSRTGAIDLRRKIPLKITDLLEEWGRVVTFGDIDETLDVKRELLMSDFVDLGLTLAAINHPLANTFLESLPKRIKEDVETRGETAEEMTKTAELYRDRAVELLNLYRTEEHAICNFALEYGKQHACESAPITHDGKFSKAFVAVIPTEHQKFLTYATPKTLEKIITAIDRGRDEAQNFIAVVADFFKRNPYFPVTEISRTMNNLAPKHDFHWTFDETKQAIVELIRQRLEA